MLKIYNKYSHQKYYGNAYNAVICMQPIIIPATLEHESRVNIRSPIVWRVHAQTVVSNCFTAEVVVLAVDRCSVCAGRILCYTFAIRNLIQGEGLRRAQLPLIRFATPHNSRTLAVYNTARLSGLRPRNLQPHTRQYNLD